MQLDKMRRRRRIVVGSMMATNVYATSTLAMVAFWGGLGSLSKPHSAVLIAWIFVFWSIAAMLVNRRMKRAER